MLLKALPTAAVALVVVRREIAAALNAVEAIAGGDELVYRDDFGTVFVDPVHFADGAFSTAALGLLAAAEGLTLAFSDEEASSFAVGDLGWAATNLQAVSAELVEVARDQLQLPYDERVEHIRRALFREISLRTEVDIAPVLDRAPVMLRGSDLLDAQQRAAVEASSDVDLLVNAGAGSGKTHMLTMRIARLVGENDVAADRCIVLTFSRGAREQVQSRLSAFALAEYPALSRADVRTIHSLGRRILQMAASAGKTRVRPGFHVVTDGRHKLSNGKTVTAPLPFIEQFERIFEGIADGRSDRARLTLYPSAINALRMGYPHLGVVPTAAELEGTGVVAVLDPRTGDLTDLVIKRRWRNRAFLLSQSVGSGQIGSQLLRTSAKASSCALTPTS
jgi:hypothetical protein